MIPQVVASERGRAQTAVACCCGVVGLFLERHIKLKHLESCTIVGESPVSRNCVGRTVS
jgi:hypothetical protein